MRLADVVKVVAVVLPVVAAAMDSPASVVGRQVAAPGELPTSEAGVAMILYRALAVVLAAERLPTPEAYLDWELR